MAAEPSKTRPWRLLPPLVRPHRWRIVRLSISSFLAGLVEAIALVLVAKLALVLTTDRDTIGASLGPLTFGRMSIGTLIVIVLALPVLLLGISAVSAHQTATLASATVTGIRRRLLRAFFRASWGLQSEERLGQLQELMTTYSYQVFTTVSALAAGLGSLLTLGALLGAAAVVNLAASVLVGAAVLLLTILLYPVRAVVQRRSRVAAAASAALATRLTERSTMMQEIRVFGVEAPVVEELEESVAAHGRALFGTRLTQQLAPATYQSLALLLVVVALGGVYISGFGQLASLGAVVLIMLRSLSYGQQLHVSVQAIHEGAPYLEALRDRLAAYEDASIEHVGDPITKIDELSFEHVSFEYLDDTPVLSDVSFSTGRGELIGIVGPSASGKSTLVQLLLRLRAPTSGVLKADGRDARGLSIDDWYRRVAYVPQDDHLITGTVAENIRFFRDADQAETERAARLAHIYEEIMDLPRGFESSVGERGGQLSGGQRQRICIARALMGAPDVLVFDEPTSALDAHSESVFRATLESLSSRAMIFVIAHRMSTLRSCDRIMVLHGGQLQHFDDPNALEISDPFFREVLRVSGLR